MIYENFGEISNGIYGVGCFDDASHQQYLLGCGGYRSLRTKAPQQGRKGAQQEVSKMKRTWTVHVKGYRTFSMVLLDGELDHAGALAEARSIWPTCEVS